MNPNVHLKIICKEVCCIINQQLMWCDMYLRMYIHHIIIMYTQHIASNGKIKLISAYNENYYKVFVTRLLSE
jgi:hypothetical protein